MNMNGPPTTVILNGEEYDKIEVCNLCFVAGHTNQTCSIKRSKTNSRSSKSTKKINNKKKQHQANIAVDEDSESSRSSEAYLIESDDNSGDFGLNAQDDSKQEIKENKDKDSGCYSTEEYGYTVQLEETIAESNEKEEKNGLMIQIPRKRMHWTTKSQENCETEDERNCYIKLWHMDDEATDHEQISSTIITEDIKSLKGSENYLDEYGLMATLIIDSDDETSVEKAKQQMERMNRENEFNVYLTSFRKLGTSNKEILGRWVRDVKHKLNQINLYSNIEVLKHHGDINWKLRRNNQPIMHIQMIKNMIMISVNMLSHHSH